MYLTLFLTLSLSLTHLHTHKSAHAHVHTDSIQTHAYGYSLIIYWLMTYESLMINDDHGLNKVRHDAQISKVIRARRICDWEWWYAFYATINWNWICCTVLINISVSWSKQLILQQAYVGYQVIMLKIRTGCRDICKIWDKVAGRYYFVVSLIFYPMFCGPQMWQA